MTIPIQNEFITVKDFYDKNKEVLTKSPSINILIKRIRENKIPFSNDLYFPLLPSFVGTRICYSSKHPLELFKEFEKKDYVVNLLNTLFNKGHYSVFAHSPMIAEDYIYREIYDSTKCLYKGFYIKNYAILNLRHIIEILDVDIKPFLFWLYDMDKAKFIPDIKIYGMRFTANGIVNEYEYSYDDVIKKDNDEFLTVSDLAERDMFELYLIDYSKFTKPFGWFSVMFHGGSVIMTHQLVRHTFFNFNQRSYRYTSAKKNRINLTAIKKHTKLELVYDLLNKIYNYIDLISSMENIPNEDLRFLLPWGQPTTIILSGPYLVFEDFIYKRLHEKSQWEIKLFAEKLDMLINRIILNKK